MGCPKYRVGSSASIMPPVHAQSAGDQNTSAGLGNQSCDATKPGRLPISTRGGSRAPLGAPVVPEQAAPGQHALVGEADADDLLQVGAVVTDGQQVGAGGVVHNGDAGFGVAQAGFQGLGAEQGR
ncbi:hypothetical protein G6F24_016947 [Rhizopus arrhizus]|nr:hypothetical protein G6F24_016947 [Rhizopus arrhizus]